MTAKKDCVDLDVAAVILHAAELGMPIDQYTSKVALMARKKLRLITRGMKKED